MLAIFKRDFKSYFVTMIGCAFIAFILGITGIYFSYYCLNAGYPYFGDVICNIASIMVLSIPIVTMKSFAEEQKSKSDQLLYTSRISITKVVLGKFMAIAAIWLIPMIVSCIFPLVVNKLGKAYFASDYASILAVTLIGLAYIAIGVFISSLTESPIIAGVVTFAILLVFQLMSGITSFIYKSSFTSMFGIAIIILVCCLIYYTLTKNIYIASLIAIIGCIINIIAYMFKKNSFYNLLPGFLNKLPLTSSLSNFSLKILDVSALVYYVTVTAVFLFLTTQSIKKRRYS